jgi:ribosomal protein S18 acetylase RimI-like enzyme
MNVQIRDLSSISISELVQVFNHAFADYAIPISLTVELMESKIVQEHIQLNLSVGVFDEDKIVGFILSGVLWLDGYLNVYNAGTGVIPQYRGQEWTKKMYAFLDQKLKTVQVKQHQLEVLTTNKKAIHLYTSLGFKISRTLSCYKGFIARHEIYPKIKIIEKANIEQHVLKTFWTIEPALAIFISFFG